MTAALLATWMPAQRWFGGKGRAMQTRRVGGWSLPSPAAGVRLETHLVAVDYVGGDSETYQVPLSFHPTAVAALAPALIGVLDDGTHVYDGPHDPLLASALLEALARGGNGVQGHLVAGASLPAPGTASHVLRGEQSNTSVIVDAGDHPVIVKLFRMLHAGENPDVVLQSALATAGCDEVPGTLAWLSGSWTTAGGEVQHGHLAVAQPFLTGATDAWRVAGEAVAAGRSIEREAEALGAATARVHGALASALPTVPLDRAALADVSRGLVERVRWAVGAVPLLATFGERAASVAAGVAALDASTLPALQRIHGDYHLGQVLDHPTRGWVLLDFEGEPLRSLSERVRPDAPARDVAGMLRSIDYAAGQAAQAGVESAGWAAATRAAFLAGYAGAAGYDPSAPGTASAALLRALEVDKALYEVVYETRNRPSWVDVPRAALDRLLA